MPRRDYLGERGFSLMELIITMGVAGILMGLATFYFSNTQRKADIEKETAAIYANLMTIRLEALNSKTARTVTMSAKSFRIYSSNVITPTPIQLVPLGYPVITNAASGRINFDASGLLVDASGNVVTGDTTICIDPTGSLGENPGNTDSVEVAVAKTYMGKRTTGGTCVPGNITQK